MLGTDSYVIALQAGHKSPDTTWGSYIKRGPDLRQRFGEPFPALPRVLLEPSRAIETGRTDLGSRRAAAPVRSEALGAIDAFDGAGDVAPSAVTGVAMHEDATGRLRDDEVDVAAANRALTGFDAHPVGRAGAGFGGSFATRPPHPSFPAEFQRRGRDSNPR